MNKFVTSDRHDDTRSPVRFLLSSFLFFFPISLITRSLSSSRIETMNRVAESSHLGAVVCFRLAGCRRRRCRRRHRRRESIPALRVPPLFLSPSSGLYYPLLLSLCFLLALREHFSVALRQRAFFLCCSYLLSLIPHARILIFSLVFPASVPSTLLALSYPPTIFLSLSLSLFLVMIHCSQCLALQSASLFYHFILLFLTYPFLNEAN